MKRIPTPTTCRPFKRVSASLATSLTECMFRAAQERSPELKPYIELSPEALLGVVCHSLMERVSSGRLPPPQEDPVPDREALLQIAANMWDQEISRVKQEFHLLEHVEVPERWPGYGMKRARAVRLVALELQSMLAKSTPYDTCGIVYVEKELVGASGKLHGRPDRVLEGPKGLIVEDFKTGAIRDPVGKVLDRHRRQLLIYCWLVYENTAKWPVLVRLRALEGSSYEERPDLEEARSVVTEVLQRLEQYNSILIQTGQEPEKQMTRLASPSASACRWCQVRPWCEVYWGSKTKDDLASDSRADIEGVLIEEWRPPSPMRLSSSDKQEIRLAVSPGVRLGDGYTLANGALVRCVAARRLSLDSYYLADSYSGLWWKEAR